MAASTNQLLNEEEKELLFSRVKELDLVDADDDVKCVRCGKFLISHYTANCGHFFCPNCKRVVDDGSQRWKCPKCQQFITKIGKQDVELERKVCATSAHCPNRKYGCNFVGRLKQICQHLPACQNTREMSLPVELKREESVPNRILEVLESLSERMIKVEKKIRDVENKLGQIEKAHLRDTQVEGDARVAEELSGRMKRLVDEAEVEKQRSQLEQNEIRETIKGLESGMDRLRLTQLHVTKAVLRLGGSGSEQWPLVKDYLDLEQWARNSQEALSVLTWRVEGVQPEAENAKEMSSPVFDLPGYSGRAQAHLKFNYFTGSILLSLQLLGPSTTQGPPPRFICCFRDQSGSGEDYVRTALVPPKDLSRRAEVTYWCRLNSIPLLHPPICSDNALLIHLKVEPPLLPEVSRDGVLFDRICHYSGKKELARKYIGCSHVSPFFSTVEGRRLQLKMDIDDEGQLRAEVEWLPSNTTSTETILHQVLLTLLNPAQTGNSQGQDMVKHSRQGFGAWTMDVGSAEAVEGLLHQDTLYYKAEVKATKL